MVRGYARPTDRDIVTRWERASLTSLENLVIIRVTHFKLALVLAHSTGAGAFFLYDFLNGGLGKFTTQVVQGGGGSRCRFGKREDNLLTVVTS